MISFKEILDTMANGEVFSCQVVSYDRKQQKGGELKEYTGVLLQKELTQKLRPPTEAEREKEQVTTTKRPNHYDHYTRNIRLVTKDGFKTDIIRKLHIPLIIKFNGQKVTP